MKPPLAGPNSFSWDLTSPSIPPGTYVIRVQEVDGGGTPIGDVYGDSSATFKVVGAIAITNPPVNPSPPTWVVNQNDATTLLTWTKNPGSLGNVKVEYSIDDGATWPGGAQIISASNSGTTQAFTVPASAVSASYMKFKVSLVSDPTNVQATSDRVKARGTLQVVLPNATTDILKVDQSYNITWTSKDFLNNDLNWDNVDISYSFDGTIYTPITGVNGVPAIPAAYSWTPDPAVQSDTVKIKVQGHTYTDVADTSDNFFKIKPNMVILTHNGGGAPIWYVDAYSAAASITWETHAKAGTVNNVNLYYCKGALADDCAGSGTWNAIPGTAGLSNINAYSWSVADAIGLW